MSATNKTTHYELPSFLGSDKPAWLVDWNGAMATIDAAIYEAKQTADGAALQASTNAGDILSLTTTVSGIGTDLGVVSTALTTLTGTVNTITSLIGNGTPTTTDKTLIGAINEINAIVSQGAAGVTYSNTTSGLTADDVQEGIDELAESVDTINATLENKISVSGSNTCGGVMTKVTDTRLLIMYQDIAGNPTAEGNMRIDLETDKLRWQLYDGTAWNTIKEITWD